MSGGKASVASANRRRAAMALMALGGAANKAGARISNQGVIGDKLNHLHGVASAESSFRLLLVDIVCSMSRFRRHHANSTP